MIVLFLIALLAQPVTDLGVMTPNRAIVLEKCTNRNDFVNFTVEIKGRAETGWSSNYVKFTTTNSILRMQDFAPILPGPCVMSVKSVCADGEESPLSLFKLDIRRDGPKAPQAHLVSTGAMPSHTSLTNAMRAARQRPVQMPSAPFVQQGSAAQTNILPIANPMPNGKPETYSEGILRMERFYASRQGKRRNE